MKRIYFILKIFFSMTFFFVFWVGALYLWDIFFGSERVLLTRIAGALLMAMIFSYFTDYGAVFGKMAGRKA